MTPCNCCNQSFRWVQVLATNLFFSKASCENCGCRHKVYFIDRFLFSLITVVPLVVFSSLIYPFENHSLNILGGLGLFIIGLMGAPFVSRYKYIPGKGEGNAAFHRSDTT